MDRREVEALHRRRVASVGHALQDGDALVEQGATSSGARSREACAVSSNEPAIPAVALEVGAG